jgi:predicted ATPase
MISRIEAYRYRCFQKLDLALDKFHVFAGSNGSGKTTLLDIPALIGDMVSVTDINDAFFTALNGRSRARAENPKELVHKLRGDDFTLAVEVRLPQSIIDLLVRNAASSWAAKFRDEAKRPDTVRYELAVSIRNGQLVVTEEHLLIFPDNQYRPDHGAGLVASGELPSSQPWCQTVCRRWGEKTQYRTEYHTGTASLLRFGLRDNQLALSSIPADNDLYPAALWLREYLIVSAFCYEPQWPVMRVAASPRDRKFFKPDGSSLAWQVLDLHENDLEGFKNWQELVTMTLPNVVQVEAKLREDDGYCYLILTYKNEMKVPSSSLSHGTLHILALTIIPFVENIPSILTLEEPENGLHPQAIHTVLEALQLAEKTQLWMSTHSPTVLADCELESIITMRVNAAGETEVVKGTEHPRLKDWKKEISLGTLFAAGAFE